MPQNVSTPVTADVEASGAPAPTFSLATKPDGMTIDAASGLIQWTPAATGVNPPAQQSFVIQVSVAAGPGPARLFLPVIAR